jgi:Zn-dependent protease with chaperone function
VTRLLSAILSCLCLAVPVATGAERSNNDTDVQGVLDAFKGKSFAALKGEFARSRVPIYDKSFRTLIIDANVRQGDLHLIEDKSLSQVVRDRVRPVLKLYGRESIDIVIFDSPAPNAICVGGTALFYSTAMLRLARRKELEAITAHELAHEYFQATALRARERNDYRTLRRVELMCDAFAVAALRELGLGRSHFKAILTKLTNDSHSLGWRGNGTDTHPPLQTRLEAIDALDRVVRR